MNYICIGKIVNTHGIKGEIRILSNFDYKDKIFIKGFKLYIGSSKEKVTINIYRHHKCFDMCLFEEYNYINDVLKFKGQKVYINREDLILNETEILDNDLIGLDAFYNDNRLGKITDIINRMKQSSELDLVNKNRLEDIQNILRDICDVT